MSDVQQDIIEELIAWAKLDLDPTDFSRNKVKAESASLYANAQSAFGSWDAALGAALTTLASMSSQRKGRSAPIVSQAMEEPPEERLVTEEAQREGLAVAVDGRVSRMPLPSFEPSTDGEFFELPGDMSETIRDFIPGRHDASLAVLSRGGELVGMLREQYPAHVLTQKWLNYTSEYSEPLSGWCDAVLRNQIRRYDRIYFFSAYGKVKAGDAQDYARRVDSSGVPGIILREGDEAYGVTVGSKRSNICVASSGGKAIVFEPGDVRVQGLKAQGVKAISLDDGDRVVGAFLVDEPESYVVCSAGGYAKLLDPQEFRSQGRAGAGLQTCRLGTDDHVALFTPASLSEDILLFTNKGRYVRIPAYRIAPMGRAARGNHLFDLQPDETIIGGRVIPPGELS